MRGPCYQRDTIKTKPKVKYQYRSKGKQIKDKELIDQLSKIKIPATYTKVTICPHQSNNLIATGYDGTDRKQYFYSQKHQEESSKNKYCNLIKLGNHLPKILKDINKLIKQKDINQDVIDALALRVMILCNFRVGNGHNVKKYNTYGLSTLTNEHLTIKGGVQQAHIKFNGKKQQVNECLIKDKKTVNFLKRLSQNRNKLDKNSKETLFSYNNIKVTPESLNDFLSKYDPDITTKVWRTWFANISYLSKIIKHDIPETKTARKRLSNSIIKEIAEELHHTPAVNKRNYLIKELPDMYVDNVSKWKSFSKKEPGNFLMSYLKTICK